MKTLIILSVCLLALASCCKEVPEPDPDPATTTDPGDCDPPPCCYNDHSANTVTWSTAANPSPIG